LFSFFLCFINILFLLHSGDSWSFTDFYSAVKIRQQLGPTNLIFFKCCYMYFIIWNFPCFVYIIIDYHTSEQMKKQQMVVHKSYLYSPIFSEVAPFYPFPFVHPLSDPISVMSAWNLSSLPRCRDCTLWGWYSIEWVASHNLNITRYRHYTAKYCKTQFTTPEIYRLE